MNSLDMIMVTFFVVVSNEEKSVYINIPEDGLVLSFGA